MTTTSYRSRSAVGVRQFFPSRHYSAVRSRLGARGTMSAAARRWVFVIFFRRGTTLLSSRLGARGTMTTTSYRSRSAVSVRHIFSVEALLGSQVASCARGTMTTTSYRSRSAVGVRHHFSVEALLCCLVASWCTRNDDNDILPHPRGGGCSSPFFRRGTTLLSGRVLVHAEG
ncbi:hypothetical protein TNCV_1580111 [Trichonephila clavipes]|nr:hypothetical protein TNCV_1580111 [Trichonephila clavipes]